MPEPAPDSFAPINRQDVEKPDTLAFRLNLLFRRTFDQVSKLIGVSGPCRMGAGPYTFTGLVTHEKQVEFQEGAKIAGATDRLGNHKVLMLEDLAEYANDAAAKLGGLVPGDLYRTATGQVMVVLDF